MYIKGTTFIKGATLGGPKNKGVHLTAKHLTTPSAEQVIKGAKVHLSATALAAGLPSHSHL